MATTNLNVRVDENLKKTADTLLKRTWFEYVNSNQYLSQTNCQGERHTV